MIVDSIIGKHIAAHLHFTPTGYKNHRSPLCVIISSVQIYNQVSAALIINDILRW